MFSKKAIDSITRYYTDRRVYAGDGEGVIRHRVAYNTVDDSKREARDEVARALGITGVSALAGYGVYDWLTDD